MLRNTLVLGLEAHLALVEHDGETRRTVLHLAKLYDAWGKPKQAAEWEAELDALITRWNELGE